MKFRISIFICSLLFLFFVFKTTFKSSDQISVPTITPTPTPFIEKNSLMVLIQDWRIQNGLKEYKESSLLCKIASLRLEEIKTDWSHDGFYKMASYCGTMKCTLGENLARGFASSKDTLNGWLNSPTHKKNLETKFEYTCLETDGNYVVQIFGF
jgi:uncharacterized protein YkwD